MGKSKHRGIDESKIPHYLKDGGTSGGRFIPVTNSFMLSKRVQALTPNARWMLEALAMEKGDSGNNEVSLSHSGAKKYGFSKSGYDAAIRQLKEGGFIRLADGISRLETNRFVFLYDWHQKPPPE